MQIFMLSSLLTTIGRCTCWFVTWYIIMYGLIWNIQHILNESVTCITSFTVGCHVYEKWRLGPVTVHIYRHSGFYGSVNVVFTLKFCALFVLFCLHVLLSILITVNCSIDALYAWPGPNSLKRHPLMHWLSMVQIDISYKRMQIAECI